MLPLVLPCRHVPSAVERFPVDLHSPAPVGMGSQHSEITEAWKRRIHRLHQAKDEHENCLQEVAERVGLRYKRRSCGIHRQICESQREALRQSCSRYIRSARDLSGEASTGPNSRHQEDRRFRLLCVAETMYAIRAKAVELEESCLGSAPSRSVQSASFNLGKLMLLHQQTVKQCVLLC